MIIEYDFNEIFIRLKHYDNQEYVAKIVGKDKKYGLKREFLVSFCEDWIPVEKRKGTTIFQIKENGVYEINEPGEKRKYFSKLGFKFNEIEFDDVLRVLNEIKTIEKNTR
jgi:hypothetical protein